jgi:hypothetical protein
VTRCSSGKEKYHVVFNVCMQKELAKQIVQEILYDNNHNKWFKYIDQCVYNNNRAFRLPLTPKSYDNSRYYECEKNDFYNYVLSSTTNCLILQDEL